MPCNELEKVTQLSSKHVSSLEFHVSRLEHIYIKGHSYFQLKYDMGETIWQN